MDDDISIHQIWAGRLQSLNIESIEHIKFQSGDVFEKYVMPKHRSSIDILPWHVLQGMDFERKDSFILHLFSCGPALSQGLIRVNYLILGILLLVIF